MTENKPKMKGYFIQYPPVLEDIFFAVLLVFSMVFGLLFYGIGENIRKEGLVAQKPQTAMEREIGKMVSGHPIEQMVPYISEKDQKTASFLVAIAKKESNWGKLSPKKDGRDCYNYWGYRGIQNRTKSGYSCFDSPSQAVNIVGGRIEDLMNKKIDTPREMVVAWKCGFDCSWDNPAAVHKWVKDVDFYFKKIASF